MLASCDICGKQKELKEKSFLSNKERNNGKYICAGCKFKLVPRPQNQKGFWSQPHLQEKLRNAMKHSDKFKESRKVVSEKLCGEGNPMFGLSHTTETRAKMSNSRKGKFGENATAWKGGSRSLNAQVKSAVYKRHNWHQKIYERDQWKCVECGSTKQLDAHHTIPFSVLLKRLLETTTLIGDELIDWLADHPILVEADGQTLCRCCHRLAHKNWGSHYSEVHDG